VQAVPVDTPRAVADRVAALLDGAPLVRRGLDPNWVWGCLELVVAELLAAMGERDVAVEEAQRTRDALRRWQSRGFADRQAAPPGRASRILPPAEGGGGR
jgi:hypothetical protein